MATEIGRMITYFDGLLPVKSRDPVIMCLFRSYDNLKSYLHYHSAYGHQT